MRSNKLLKILWGVVFAIFVICVVFVVVGYFGGGDSSTSNKSSTSSQTSQQDKSTDEEKYRSGQDSQSSSNNKEEANNVIIGSNNGVIDGNNSNNNNSSSNNKDEYNGKKLSHNEGLGTTGKVFNTQKEALEYGNSEIERLVKEDKKPRQFSISKVSDEDGNIVGWTVDIFESGDSKTE